MWVSSVLICLAFTFRRTNVEPEQGPFKEDSSLSRAPSLSVPCQFGRAYRLAKALPLQIAVEAKKFQHGQPHTKERRKTSINHFICMFQRSGVYCTVFSSTVLYSSLPDSTLLCSALLYSTLL